MEDLKKDSTPLPDESSPSEVDENGSSRDFSFSCENENENLSPTEKKMPRNVYVNSSQKIHIGHVINCSTQPWSRDQLMNNELTKPKRCPSKRHVEALLNCNFEINDDMKDTVSEYIGYNWRSLGRKMGYKEAQLDDIEACCSSPKPSDRAFKLLSRWHDRESIHATVANLTRLLMKVSAFESVIMLNP